MTSKITIIDYGLGNLLNSHMEAIMFLNNEQDKYIIDSESIRNRLAMKYVYSCRIIFGLEMRFLFK